jgi:hypothetical protein
VTSGNIPEAEMAFFFEFRVDKSKVLFLIKQIEKAHKQIIE